MPLRKSISLNSTNFVIFGLVKRTFTLPSSPRPLELTLDQLPRPACLQPSSSQPPAGPQKPTRDQGSQTKLEPLNSTPFSKTKPTCWVSQWWKQGVGALCRDKSLVLSQISACLWEISSFLVAAKYNVSEVSVELRKQIFQTSVSSRVFFTWRKIHLNFSKYAREHLFWQLKLSLANVRLILRMHLSLTLAS